MADMGIMVDQTTGKIYVGKYKTTKKGRRQMIGIATEISEDFVRAMLTKFPVNTGNIITAGDKPFCRVTITTPDKVVTVDGKVVE